MENRICTAEQNLVPLKCIVERRSKGQLFKAYQKSSANFVMLRKVMLDVTNAGVDDGVPTSILREISFLKAHKHDSLVRLTDASVKGKNMNILTEHLHCNLKEVIKLKKFREGNVGLPMACAITFKVMEGLNYMHGQGLIHRNLKSENVLLHFRGNYTRHELQLISDEKGELPESLNELVASATEEDLLRAAVCDLSLAREVTIPHGA